jgi:hypothetical protein
VIATIRSSSSASVASVRPKASVYEMAVGFLVRVPDALSNDAIPWKREASSSAGG